MQVTKIMNATYSLCVFRQDGWTVNRWSGTSMSSCDYSGGVQKIQYNSLNSVMFGTGEL